MATKYNPHSSQRNTRVDKEKLLQDLKDEIEKTYATKEKFEMAPSWFIENATDKEVTQNWKDVYKNVDERSLHSLKIPIVLHIIFKLEKEKNEFAWKQDYTHIETETLKTNELERICKCAITSNQTCWNL